MHNQFATKLYNSYAWRKCREAYRSQRGGLCERCLARGLIVPGDEVHHKVRITPTNMTDPTITLNPDNLELLCRECHKKEHEGREHRMRTDADGHVTL